MRKPRIPAASPLLRKLTARPNVPLVVSGYTIASHLGDYYKRCIGRLILSCIKFDLAYLVFPLDYTTNYPTWKQKDWIIGCSLKTEIIYQVLSRLNQPILWLDADAEIFNRPRLLEGLEAEMALCAENNHWLTGTLYAKPSTIPFIDEWRKRMEKSIPDEDVLIRLHSQYNRPPKVTLLPNTYNTTIHANSDTSKLVIGHHMRPDVATARHVKASAIPQW